VNLWLKILLFNLIGLSLALGSMARAETFIRVRPNVYAPPNSEVKLSQLVDSDGLSPSVQAKLRSIAVSKAPDEGERQEIDDANIMAVLRPIVQEERVRSKRQIQLIVPKTVTVVTSHNELDRKQIESELMQAWKPLCARCQLDIQSLNIPNVKNIRDWSLKISGDLPKGSFSVPMNIIRADGSPLSAWVSGRLIVKRRVPVATHLLNINERVTAKDFDWIYKDTSYAIDGIPTAEDLVGQRLKQGLRADDILWKNMLERERAVRRGDLVQIRSSSGSWEVTMNAVAQEDGFVGDMINLKTAKSNTTLVGEITGHGEADIK
jgi:flagella basal body P-ring formation protein FlgA